MDRGKRRKAVHGRHRVDHFGGVSRSFDGCIDRHAVITENRWKMVGVIFSGMVDLMGIKVLKTRSCVVTELSRLVLQTHVSPSPWPFRNIGAPQWR